MRFLAPFVVAILAVAGPLLAEGDGSVHALIPAVAEKAGDGAASQPGHAGTVTLISAPAAVTADSIALLWSKPAGVAVEGYEVYSGDKLVTATKNTDCTLRGLMPAQGYGLSVRARVAGGKVVESNVVHVTTKAAGKVFDVTGYGAVGDGKTVNTQAIQTAIDVCVGNGVVRIPKGTFLCGAIYLKSDMTLQLEEGAVLLGSADTKDYPVMKYRCEGREVNCYASLINTRSIENGVRWHDITIEGSGKIDGNGMALRPKELKEVAGRPGRVVCVRDTDGVYLDSVTVKQTPFWCVHLIYCNGVSVNGVGIYTREDENGKPYRGIVNGDGLDPDSCRDVAIFNCHIVSEDDCIALKSGRDAEGRAVGIPTEDVRISDCSFTSGFGVAMGSEMSGGIRNVLVEDCTFAETFSLASVKAIRGRGSVIENVTYRDCTYTNTDKNLKDTQYFRGAIYVDQFYGDAKFDAGAAKPKDESTPTIRNLLFENLTVETAAGNAIYMAGLAENPLENVRLVNVKAKGQHGFIGYNIEGLTQDHVTVEAGDGQARQFTNVKETGGGG